MEEVALSTWSSEQVAATCGELVTVPSLYQTINSRRDLERKPS